jgi:hypothetical protein
VKPNQIWRVKTNSGGYGKILILKTKTGHHDDKPFAEVNFMADILSPEFYFLFLKTQKNFRNKIEGL